MYAGWAWLISGQPVLRRRARAGSSQAEASAGVGPRRAQLAVLI